MHDGDVGVRQLHVRVELLDRRIIPLGDLAGVDLGQRLAVETQLARLNALEMYDRYNAAHDHRELQQAVLVQLIFFQRRIRRTEIDGLGFDLLDTATGADGLVVELHAGLLLVGLRPLRIHRVRERRASAVDLVHGCTGRPPDRQRRNGCDQRLAEIHSQFSFLVHGVTGGSRSNPAGALTIVPNYDTHVTDDVVRPRRRHGPKKQSPGKPGSNESHLWESRAANRVVTGRGGAGAISLPAIRREPLGKATGRTRLESYYRRTQ